MAIRTTSSFLNLLNIRIKNDSLPFHSTLVDNYLSAIGSQKMIKKSTILHLRFPFSFFLLPVFLFAIATYQPDFGLQFWLVFFILHFLLYPASNGYNSFFDKDEQSIGGLKNPPKVSKELFYVSWGMDVLAIALGFWISWEFAVMLFIYGLVSKAYSHPKIRLKKMPIIGWLAAGIFQGYFTFLMVIVALQGSMPGIWNWSVQLPALLTTMLLFGSYPMTQIYQHEEDSKRGDRTMSLILGITGTFHFTALCFTVSVGMYCWYFIHFYEPAIALYFLVALSPVLLFFGWWYWKARKDVSAVNFQHTMQLNLLSSMCLNLFFLYLTFM